MFKNTHFEFSDFRNLIPSKFYCFPVLQPKISGEAAAFHTNSLSGYTVCSLFAKLWLAGRKISLCIGCYLNYEDIERYVELPEIMLDQSGRYN